LISYQIIKIISKNILRKRAQKALEFFWSSRRRRRKLFFWRL